MVPGYPAMTQTSSAPMSMPNSRALVDTTARTAPSRNPFSISRRPIEIVFEIRRQDFGRQPALGEDDQLESALEKLSRHPSRLTQVRPPDPELLIDDRRIHEQKRLLAAGSAIFRNELERLFDQ